jgi:hypothetical protein
MKCQLFILTKKKIITVKINIYDSQLKYSCFFDEKSFFMTVPSVLNSSRCLLLAVARLLAFSTLHFPSGIGCGWKSTSQTARLRNLMYKILLQNLEQFPRSERHSKVSHWIFRYFTSLTLPVGRFFGISGTSGEPICTITAQSYNLIIHSEGAALCRCTWQLVKKPLWNSKL